MSETPELALPAVDATTVHGWLAALGATRVLAARYPALTLHFAERTPVLRGGPTTAADASEQIHADTIGRIPPGGVLPGIDATRPPAGKDWWRHPDAPPLPMTPWDGAEAWQAALVSPSGLLHPLISPHAAQTVRGMISKAGGLLAQRPGLLTDALVRIGTAGDDYPGGLWLHQPGSPGRDWLAIMALPWMPAVDDRDYTPDHASYRRCAPGWRWRATAAGTRHLVYGWHLWPQPVPAATVPFLLGAPAYLPGQVVRCGAYRPPRTRRHDPPLMRTLTAAEIRDGALDDEPILDYGEVAQRAGISVSTLRGYVSRGQCPQPDATAPDTGARAWRPATIRPWLEREKRPGARRDLG